ncbi:hypothetical protein N617_gp22 [Stygiolobus rod-shaped virus]|uniref:Uncharacterized protein n=1 Tax=Stygiolobus rod-shaped virus TaxID=537009 RepID=B6EFC8_9VIRU|nr:hypothetical protein N617_gp22 [Stygiolobus rod-shaped virus]CAQ58463.1 hypothetical protein [Stygiolobus rod-shaped virus]
MTGKKGSRNIAQMKYKLYRKVHYSKNFPAFSQMFNAGVESVLPTSLENVSVPPGYNLNYGIAYAQLISQLLSALNNFIVSQTNPTVNNTSILNLSITKPTSSTLDAINTFNRIYDNYVKDCVPLFTPAIFDETQFGLSLFNPVLSNPINVQGCKILEQQLRTFRIQSQYIPLENLGIGKTNIPTVDNNLLNLIKNTGIGNFINQLAQKNNITPQQYFNSLPDLAKYLLAFLSLINNIIDNGVALDVAWLDRSAFSTTIGNEQQLANNFYLQYFAQALGVILDVTPLDFAVLMPDLNSSNADLAILSTDRAIISVFGSIFLQHLTGNTPGSTNIANSIFAETYITNYELFYRIMKILNRKYGNVWYAKIVGSAIIELARYYYQQNYSYTSGKRTLPYDQFLSYWKQKWSFYGISQQDLQFAQQLGESLQGLGKIQNERKKAIKSVELQNYKPIFYKSNFQNVVSR